jgi:hypothetical protein
MVFSSIVQLNANSVSSMIATLSTLYLLDFTRVCLLVCVDLDLDCHLLVGAWKLDWNMNTSMDIAIVMVACRISHSTSRLVCLVPHCLYLGIVIISSSHCRGTTVSASSESPPLSSVVFHIFSPAWSNTKKGGVQGHRPRSVS